MPRNPDMPCASCGKLIWRGRTSLPPGEATCRPCRRQRKPERPAIVQPTVRTRAARAFKSTSRERGYGYAHKKMRLFLLATFVDGTPCARCGSPMHLSQPLDLDHSDDRSGYLGLSHATCNRARRAVDHTSFNTLGIEYWVRDGEEVISSGSYPEGRWFDPSSRNQS